MLTVLQQQKADYWFPGCCIRKGLAGWSEALGKLLEMMNMLILRVVMVLQVFTFVKIYQTVHIIIYRIKPQ